MDKKIATGALGALSQETRLESFRLLVRRGADGMAVGDIATNLGTPHNTMSSHLAILVNAGLVDSRREGRSVIYSVNFNGVRALLAFLMEDCCRIGSDVCSPLLDRLQPACCPTPKPNRRKS
jgi:DNA-binding transcriptional ArsR family regulator